MILALLVAAGFTHPSLQPPPESTALHVRERRERVMKELGGLRTALASQGDPVGVVQEYRQDGHFLWLTGVDEPGAWIVLLPKGKYSRHVLYLRPRDPEAERWTGPREPISPP